jgi:hypothetical protein
VVFGDQFLPRCEVLLARDAVAARERAVGGVAFEDEDVIAVREDGDAPRFVGPMSRCVMKNGEVVKERRVRAMTTK